MFAAWKHEHDGEKIVVVVVVAEAHERSKDKAIEAEAATNTFWNAEIFCASNNLIVIACSP